MKEPIESLLNSLPFVRWDRYTENLGQYTFYGWVDRNDSYKDFVVLNFDITDGDKEIHPWFCTSSESYSKEISKILDKTGGHSDCKRVERFEGVKNAIKLRD